VPGSKAKDREERPRHALRQLEISRSEPLRLVLQEAVERPSPALVRLEQGDIDEHVERVLVGHDPPFFPDAELLCRPGQVRAAARPHGLAEHALDGGPDLPVSGRNLIARQRPSSRCTQLGCSEEGSLRMMLVNIIASPPRSIGTRYARHS
jgi:hypothetical protein